MEAVVGFLQDKSPYILVLVALGYFAWLGLEVINLGRAFSAMEARETAHFNHLTDRQKAIEAAVVRTEQRLTDRQKVIEATVVRTEQRLTDRQKTIESAVVRIEQHLLKGYSGG